MREHSAQSIVEVMRHAYKDVLEAKVTEYITENLMKAKEQKNESVKNSNLQNETQFGVAKQIEGPGEEMGHNDNQLYSCGSLAPKLKRGGGCMDHGFARAKEQWELTDGSIFLIREISGIESLQPFVVKQLENLSNLGYIDHFKHSHSLKENLFKSLAKILKSLGKKPFRESVDLFLDPAFRNAKSQEHQNMAVAAQDFILAMESVYG